MIYPISQSGKPQLPLTLQIGKKLVNVLTLVDTGFDGFLAIPEKFAQSLGILPTFKKEVTLANNENYFVGGVDLSVEMKELDFKEKVEILFIQGEKALFGLSLLSLICLDLNKDLVLCFNDCKIRFDEYPN